MSFSSKQNRPISVGWDQDLLLENPYCDLFEDSDGEREWRTFEYRDEAPIGTRLLEALEEEDEEYAAVQDHHDEKRLNLIKRQPDPEDDGPIHYQEVAMEELSTLSATRNAYRSIDSIFLLFTKWRLRREIKNWKTQLRKEFNEREGRWARSRRDTLSLLQLRDHQLSALEKLYRRRQVTVDTAAFGREDHFEFILAPPYGQAPLQFVSWMTSREHGQEIHPSILNYIRELMPYVRDDIFVLKQRVEDKKRQYEFAVQLSRQKAAPQALKYLELTSNYSDKVSGRTHDRERTWAMLGNLRKSNNYNFISVHWERLESIWHSATLIDTKTQGVPNKPCGRCGLSLNRGIIDPHVDPLIAKCANCDTFFCIYCHTTLGLQKQFDTWLFGWPTKADFDIPSK